MTSLKAALVLAVISASISSASAQRGGNSLSSMGGSGFSGGMMNGMSSSLGGTGSFGSGMNGLGSGMSGFGGGMGMGGSGMGGFGSGMGMGGSGMGGFGQNSMGMNGQSQGFIGRDSADMSAIFNELGRNSNQFMQQLNRTMQRGGGRRNTAQEENVVLPVRVRLDVAFDHPAVPSAIAASKVRTRMETLLTRRNVAAPDVEVVGDTVVLRGIAKSESQKLVIEKLVLLEPGVYTVDNQMTVEDEPPAPSTPVAP